MDGSEGYTVTVRVPLISEILQRWQELEPLLRRATARSEGCWEPEDILALLFAARATMLLIEAADGLRVVVVVEIKQFPRRRTLDVSFVGGRPGNSDVKIWAPILTEHLNELARSAGATLLTASGRIGWARAAKLKLTGGTMVRKVM